MCPRAAVWQLSNGPVSLTGCQRRVGSRMRSHVERHRNLGADPTQLFPLVDGRALTYEARHRE